MQGRLFPWMLVAALLFGGTAFAQETTLSPPADDDWGDENDSDDFDFGDADTQDDKKVIKDSNAPSNWSFRGFIRTDWALWAERLNDSPWAKGRQNLDLKLSYKKGIFRFLAAGHAEYDLAYLVNRDKYDQSTLDTYEWDVQSREILAAISLGDVEITLGRQIVAWGEGDALSLLDVVNPRDMREPGSADIDDLRLPVLSSRIGWFIGSHRLEAMVIHESDFGLRPSAMGEFSPLPHLINTQLSEFFPGLPASNFLANKNIFYVDKQERFSLEGQQYLMRWVYKGPGVDLGLYGAYVHDQQGTIELPPTAVISQEKDLPLTLDHAQYWVTGVSGAAVWDSFLFKWEIAAELERSVNVGTFPEISSVKTDLAGGVLGITWTGVSNLMISLESSNRWYLDRPEHLLVELDQPLFALRGQYTMLRERLKLSAMVIMMGLKAEMGWMARVEANYELRDGLKLGLGYISYQPGDEFGLLLGLTNHDRIVAQLRWDFKLL
ncbi:MAG TPA: hypothetical protein EYN06_06660 [Myxococcales bacterium]|nr:hypothetical protein [Myxococcales bacterium]